ncbi:hypothetical protein F3Y22_tig00111427pilonHSYRG00326 [Hibiscus syriacus]|uniref:Retrotransposon gag domain-containing protein n=1 Tax=Hibiscus syriacus TaxID=106335 RepID=A0A6A2YK65_HIBSY|nr:hypothetical protein F3Y22_tig00111427pilonHSYRG00326 [Hibiscus syriacus]
MFFSSSPNHFDVMVDIETLMKLAPVYFTMAFASIVFPVPGWSKSKIPLQVPLEVQYCCEARVCIVGSLVDGGAWFAVANVMAEDSGFIEVYAEEFGLSQRNLFISGMLAASFGACRHHQVLLEKEGVGLEGGLDGQEYNVSSSQRRVCAMQCLGNRIIVGHPILYSSAQGELQYDPEIKKTARRLRKETNLCNKQASYSSSPESKSVVNLVDSSSDFEIEGTMANEETTLRELAAPNENQQPLWIDYPTLEVTFELKYGLIHLLRNFHGLENEDPHKHLKEFHVICSSMRPQGVTEEQIKLRAFPFSLTDRAKDWLFYLPPSSVTTWAERVRMFLDKVFPASRAALLPMERKMMDATSGGTILTKTPRDVRELISNMAANSQQFGFRKDTSSRRVNEQVKACGICATIGHPIDMCPMLQDDSHEHANAIGSYGPRPSQFQHFPPEQSSSKPGMSLEEFVKSLATNTQQFQQETRTSIQNLENQMSQLASSISRLESQGNLHSQIVVNPRQNVSAITLRSGKELKKPSLLKHGRALEEVVAPQTQKDQPKGLKSEKPKEFVIDPHFPSRFAKSKK